MGAKILFIDRDGTIIKEPRDEQVDHIDKIDFLPEALHYLRRIKREGDFIFVMVTNQDGLGTASFPEANFHPVQNLVMRVLTSEGIHFEAVHIDEHFPSEHHPNRKPGIGMLTGYLNGQYDIQNSYVIGDRLSDLELAINLGCKSIYISEKGNETADLSTPGWKEIYEYLISKPRTASVRRKTSETDIHIELCLDGSGKSSVDTGLHFFDHMLEQISRHGGFDLMVKVQGDLEIDEHHTIEDTGLALGEAFLTALGSKKGIGRYGFLLPMDDCLAQVALDFGGRPWLVWEADFKREKIGEMPTEMFSHFFKSFADASRSNLNIKADGENEHHKIESIFKAFAKSLKQAAKRNPEELENLPSTKGAL